MHLQYRTLDHNKSDCKTGTIIGDKQMIADNTDLTIIIIILLTYIIKIHVCFFTNIVQYKG